MNTTYNTQYNQAQAQAQAQAPAVPNLPNHADNLIKLDQHFREIPKNSNDPRAGTKRPSQPYEIAGYTASGLQALLNAHASNWDKLASVLNDALDKHAKELFATNKDNWEYVPSYAEVSLDTLAQRIAQRSLAAFRMTNAIYGAVATWYQQEGGTLLGRTPQQCANAAAFIADGFKMLAAHPQGIDAMLNTFVEITSREEVMNSLLASNPSIDMARVLDSILTTLEQMASSIAQPVSIDF